MGLILVATVFLRSRQGRESLTRGLIGYIMPREYTFVSKKGIGGASYIQKHDKSVTFRRLGLLRCRTPVLVALDGYIGSGLNCLPDREIFPSRIAPGELRIDTPV